MKAVEGWEKTNLDSVISAIQSGSRPKGGVTNDRGDIPSLGGENIINPGGITLGDVKLVSLDFYYKMTKGHLQNGDVLINKDGAQTGKVGFYKSPTNQLACINEHLFILRGIPNRIEQKYLYYTLLSQSGQHQIRSQISGSAQPGLKSGFIKGLMLDLPVLLSEQTKIAEILSTVDRAIEQTEALIAKQQRIKNGLMQDLLTRGIDEHGNLRSEQTHQFKDSPLGRVPVEWEVNEFRQTIDSAVDGPFGSNLKSDHYVDEPGVRVIRLGNIGNGMFLDRDKAWISSAHGRYLSRHSVQPMDLLIASLGDERHPFGRACLYADNVHEAVVKADVFRVRCKSHKLIHSFAVHLLNFPRWREGLFALAQGVTRDRVNLTNIMLLELPIPPIAEQKAIARNIGSINAILTKLERQLSKICLIKTALMQDLLTGKVRVTPLLTETQEAGA